MSEKHFSLLCENIYYSDIKEYVEMLIVTSKMLDCNVSIEYRSSIFNIVIKTPDRKRKLEINFHVNVSKKYLQKVDLTYTFRKEFTLSNYYPLDTTRISSGNIAEDLIVPLKKAMSILIES